MASTHYAAIGAAIALLFWTSLGLAITRRVVPALALPMAPVVGWAMHSAIAKTEKRFVVAVMAVSPSSFVALVGGRISPWGAAVRRPARAREGFEPDRTWIGKGRAGLKGDRERPVGLTRRILSHVCSRA